MDVLGQSQDPTYCRPCGHPSLQAMVDLDFAVVLVQSNAGEENQFHHITHTFDCLTYSITVEVQGV